MPSGKSEKKKKFRDIVRAAKEGKEIDESEISSMTTGQMSMMMPIMMFIIMFNLNGALAFYYFLSNVFTVIQQRIVLKKVDAEIDASTDKVVLKELRNVKMELEIDTAEVPVLLEKCMDKLREEYRQKENSNTLNTGQKQEGQEILKILRQYQVECAREKDKEAQFQIVRKLFNEQVLKHDEQMQMSRRSSKNAFAFIRTNWGMGQEMYLFMTELIENEIFKEFLEIWGQ
jgi:hypothetical protein